MEEKRLIFGFHPVFHLLETKIKIEEILILKGLEKNKWDKIVKKAQEKKVSLKTLDNRKYFDDLVKNENHQGVIAFIKTDFNYVPLEHFKQSQTVIFLDHLTDPHNLGAILRSCLQFKIDGVVIPDARSCQLNATVLKASSGAALFVPVCKVPNLSQALEKLKNWGFWSYAATGQEEGENLKKIQFDSKTLLILGNEGKGIAKKLKEKCDFKVYIATQQGPVDSLNVSVAAGIFFYEIHSQLGV